MEELVAALDAESAEWVAALTGPAAERAQREARLHGMLVRVALHELGRRRTTSPWLAGVELEDLAHQAAADAMLAILRKLGTFRGESRFTTWAYRFVILEVSAKLGRHYWRVHPPVALEAEAWERLPDRFGLDPAEHVQRAELVRAMGRAVDETLTAHQRRLFTAIVLEGTPLDALAVRLGTNRNAIYKTVFDARRKIRAYLVANGYLEQEGTGAR
ncbi:sigma-70 family RNA polymerase sigma factor [Actinospica sp. MGRD01-02]|uniref:Sigma-70 family RNA polymerase sigma factor n=1 Tax=Actinospica acidithermotolerans TaxID=2828514 RepID=A0A941EB51_9ACTN|nr:sigma-70 family RNA polymerase sigma factor [Actinospica acidithermotolerans]MBR7827197.1 sigma-70 family RNA polymerase sigma factor [Actinospica acidithermotolerans]